MRSSLKRWTPFRGDHLPRPSSMKSGGEAGAQPPLAALATVGTRARPKVSAAQLLPRKTPGGAGLLSSQPSPCERIDPRRVYTRPRRPRSTQSHISLAGRTWASNVNERSTEWRRSLANRIAAAIVTSRTRAACEWCARASSDAAERSFSQPLDKSLTFV